MVQETTSDPGDRIGSVNPTRSKSRQCASEGGPPEHTGRTLEVVGNGDPRWMAVTPVRATGPGDRTRLTGRLIPLPSRHVPTGGHSRVVCRTHPMKAPIARTTAPARTDSHGSSTATRRQPMNPTAATARPSQPSSRVHALALAMA